MLTRISAMSRTGWTIVGQMQSLPPNMRMPSNVGHPSTVVAEVFAGHAITVFFHMRFMWSIIAQWKRFEKLFHECSSNFMKRCIDESERKKSGTNCRNPLRVHMIVLGPYEVWLRGL